MTDTPEAITDLVDIGHGRKITPAEFAEKLAALRAPFPPDQMEKKPQPITRDENRGYCNPGSQWSADGVFCGGKHSKAIHLDYVGHAGITERLLDVDPFWNWEPMGHVPAGTPFMSDGGMWGRLTVLGITRIGFGDAVGKGAGPSATKETIGDFLRNAALRFGVATYLWSKSEEAAAKKRGELGLDDVTQEDPAAPGSVLNRPAQQPRGNQRTGTPQGRQRNAQPPPGSSGGGVDWSARLKDAMGDATKLTALRQALKNSGCPDGHPMYAAIAAAVADTHVVEGTVVQDAGTA